MIGKTVSRNHTLGHMSDHVMDRHTFLARSRSWGSTKREEQKSDI